MLIGAIALGLILGLLVGGRITNLALVRLRLVPLIAVAVILRFGTETLLGADVPIVETLRWPLLTIAFAMLLVGLWANRNYPGMNLAFVGTLANALVIVVNQGYMPIWAPALELAGLTPADVGLVDPPGLRGEPRRLVPASPRAARRRHSDPVPDHPERGLDR